MSVFCTGNHWGKTGEKCRQKIRHNKLIATDPSVRLYQHATFLIALYFQFDIRLEISMCGRFSQYQIREEYLAYLADEGNRDIAYDSERIGRYNVTSCTKIPLLSERNEQLR